MVGLRIKTKVDESIEFWMRRRKDNDNEFANVGAMSVDNSRRFTKEIKVRKRLAKCPSFIVKRKMNNLVELCSYKSFWNVNRCVQNALEDCGVPCGYSYQVSIKA
jgi:hypothetical protein